MKIVQTIMVTVKATNGMLIDRYIRNKCGNIIRESERKNKKTNIMSRGSRFIYVYKCSKCI
ncbi:hypothetical protein PMY12_08595 [Clostridium tertium]|jgi:hypothetical protein|uniref:hypothetical protein n=1 Tax=Clostridium tertium TaxID=1559 RepID=UPI00232C9255|nr:hypothetical protein [Clostridium tertium]MDB1934054.1 hypothetical protein [Clostridium tertium]MDB1937071.1 hypothetical protein [Clostridium tertium]